MSLVEACSGGVSCYLLDGWLHTAIESLPRGDRLQDPRRMTTQKILVMAPNPETPGYAIGFLLRILLRMVSFFLTLNQ